MPGGNSAEVRELLVQASELPTDQRSTFLERACADDPNLRSEVQTLLDMLDRADDFMAENSSPPPIAGGAFNDHRPADPWDGAPDVENFIAGSVIGPYRVVQWLGEGAFGTVYLVDQEHPVKRQAALKVIKLGMNTRHVMARFRNERQALAMMDHPNIARVLDAGATSSGRPYFVMELVRGVPITAFCRSIHASLRERLELFIQVCHAVQHAHHKGIIHRDIKPSNVLVTMIDGRPVPKVIDFGVARAVDVPAGELTTLAERGWIGTPQYMSPEQAGNGEDIDSRSDIYSLGVLLYELLAGRTPFDSAEFRVAPPETIRRIISSVDPQRPSSVCEQVRDNDQRPEEIQKLAKLLRREPDWIVMRCLEKDRKRRYDSASALAQDIENYLRGDPVRVGPPSRRYRIGKFVRRQKALIAAISLIAAALLLGTAGTTVGLLRALHERDAAKRSEQRAASVNDFLLRMLGSADPSQSKGKDVLVRDLLDQADQEVKANPPSDGETRGAIAHALGSSYLALGLYPLAAEQFQVSLRTTEQKYGPESVEAARAMGELADALWADFKYSQADPLYRRSLELLVARLGSDHIEVAAAEQRVANMLEGENDPDGSEQYYQKALAIRRAKLGENSLATADNLFGLAKLRRDRGKRAEAESLIKETLTIREKLLGIPNAVVAKTLFALATVSPSDQSAEETFKRALLMQQQTLGRTHPDVAVTEMYLALKMMDQQNFGSEPEAILRDALEINQHAFGLTHALVAKDLQTLAQLYAFRNQLPEAQKSFEAALDMYRHTIGEQAGEVIWVLRDMVPIMIAREDFEATEKLLLQRYQWVVDQHNPKLHTAQEQVESQLVALYDAWNKPTERDQWAARIKADFPQGIDLNSPSLKPTTRPARTSR
jgi:tetratricopeptide (TPR) repeat protein